MERPKFQSVAQLKAIKQQNLIEMKKKNRNTLTIISTTTTITII